MVVVPGPLVVVVVVVAGAPVVVVVQESMSSIVIVQVVDPPIPQQADGSDESRLMVIVNVSSTQLASHSLQMTSTEASKSELRCLLLVRSKLCLRNTVLRNRLCEPE